MKCLRSRRVAVVLATIAVALNSARPGGPAAAADEPAFELVAQPAWVNVAGDVTLRLTIPPELLAPEVDVLLKLRVYAAVTSRERFEETASGGRLGTGLGTKRVPVASLPRDAQGDAVVTFGLQGSPTVPNFDVERSGVYPLEIALEGDDTIASFVTWIVVVDPAAAPPPAPLRVASLWRLVTSPIRAVDGTADPIVASELAPGGRIDDLSTLLEAAATVPLSVQVGPETLEAWDSLARRDPSFAPGLERVKTALARTTTQVLPATYVPIDLPSLEAAGLGDELPDQFVAGSDVIERLTGVTPDPRTAVVEPVDGATLTRLRGLLVDRVVVRDTALAGERGEPAPFTIDAGGASLRAGADDSALEALIRGSEAPALRAQRLLAGLSVVALEAGGDTPHGVVLAPPERWAPDLAVNQAVLTGLTGHPLLQPSTLDQLFADVAPATRLGQPVGRELAPHVPAPFPVTAGAYDNARARLDSLRGTVGAQDPDVVRGERALLLALSSDNTPAVANGLLNVIDDAVQRLTGGVSTTHKRITLTARRADVPLNFANTTGKPVTIRVRLTSAKLLFPDGNDHVITLPQGNSTEQFTVEARASGTFPMTVFLSSADGRLAIGAPRRVTVRSAVFSGVGAALTVGALLFLAIWWGNHYRRRRRAQRNVATT